MRNAKCECCADAVANVNAICEMQAQLRELAPLVVAVLVHEYDVHVAPYTTLLLQWLLLDALQFDAREVCDLCFRPLFFFVDSLRFDDGFISDLI